MITRFHHVLSRALMIHHSVREIAGVPVFVDKSTGILASFSIMPVDIPYVRAPGPK
jgi:hypothetical protein